LAKTEWYKHGNYVKYIDKKCKPSAINVNKLQNNVLHAPNLIINFIESTMESTVIFCDVTIATEVDQAQLKSNRYTTSNNTRYHLAYRLYKVQRVAKGMYAFIQYSSDCVITNMLMRKKTTCQPDPDMVRHLANT